MNPEFIFDFSKEERERIKIFNESLVKGLLDKICRDRELFEWKQDKLFEWKQEERSEDHDPAWFNPNYSYTRMVLRFNHWYSSQTFEDVGIVGGIKEETFHWEEVRFVIDSKEKKIALVYEEEGQIKSITDENEIAKALEDVVTKSSQSQKSRYVKEMETT